MNSVVFTDSGPLLEKSLTISDHFLILRHAKRAKLNMQLVSKATDQTLLSRLLVDALRKVYMETGF